MRGTEPVWQQAAAEVRAEMARQRVTVRELSRLTGLALSTLARRVNGESPFALDELEQVADVLDVDVAGFLAAERPRRRVTQPYRDLYALAA